MKAISALRALACASLLSFVGVTKSSAQLYFHVVDTDSANVDSNNNLGVAVDIWFTFSLNATNTIGTLEVRLLNRAGTDIDGLPGGDSYTTGILTGFGFDLPGTFAVPDAPGITYVDGSFTKTASTDSVVNFVPVSPFTLAEPEGTFDFGAQTTAPHPDNGIAAGKEATFTMDFSGDAALMLSKFNAGGFFANNGTDADFGFRYLSVGTNGQGSDKFVYYDNPPIPEPSTYGLVAASVLVGLVGVRRYRARKAVVVH